jgi:hypothetical protein
LGEFVAYVGVAVIGAGTGLSELVSRYRDAPGRALYTEPGIVYLLVNASASIAAFALIHEFGLIEIQPGTDSASALLVQVLAAGFGAMAVFRSSLLTVRVANSDVGIGPVAVLGVILTAADRACDRARAQPRAKAVQSIMSGISFDLAKEALPSLCFGLMQNVQEDEQRSLTTIVTQIDASNVVEAVKTNTLGLALMNVVGEDVLRQAVSMLRADIARPIVETVETLALIRNVPFESIQQLIDGCLFLSNRLDDDELLGFLTNAKNRISNMSVPDRQKNFLLSALLIGRFGEGIVQQVLQSLQKGK